MWKWVTLESFATEWCSPLAGILAPPFDQLLCEASVESLDGREWGPVPLSDPSDIEWVHGTGSGDLLSVVTAVTVGVRAGIGVVGLTEALLFTRLTSGVRCIYENSKYNRCRVVDSRRRC